MYRQAKSLIVQATLLIVALLLVPCEPLNVAGCLLAYLWPWGFLATVVLYCIERNRA